MLFLTPRLSTGLPNLSQVAASMADARSLSSAQFLSAFSTVHNILSGLPRLQVNFIKSTIMYRWFWEFECILSRAGTLRKQKASSRRDFVVHLHEEGNNSLGFLATDVTRLVMVQAVMRSTSLHDEEYGVSAAGYHLT